MPDDVLRLLPHDLPHHALELDRAAALVELLSHPTVALVNDRDLRDWKKRTFDQSNDDFILLVVGLARGIAVFLLHQCSDWCILYPYSCSLSDIGIFIDYPTGIHFPILQLEVASLINGGTDTLH